MPKVALVLIGIPHLLTQSVCLTVTEGESLPGRISHYVTVSIRRAREKDRPFYRTHLPLPLGQAAPLRQLHLAYPSGGSCNSGRLFPCVPGWRGTRSVVPLPRSACPDRFCSGDF